MPETLRPITTHEGSVSLNVRRIRSPGINPATRAELGECGVSSRWEVRGDIVRGVG